MATIYKIEFYLKNPYHASAYLFFLFEFGVLINMFLPQRGHISIKTNSSEIYTTPAGGLVLVSTI
jgi:hypothetical protein